MPDLRRIAIFAFLIFPSLLPAQESSSSGASTPGAASTSPSNPSFALRDILVASCAHDEAAFRQFLTARNAQSFSSLTPPARTELMKRFVLLAEAGKATFTSNPAGFPVVRCETPYGTAEIQLGGADTRDNLSYIPIDLREVSDPQSGEAHHILMTMVRENNRWKVASLGLLFLDLPSLEVEWDRAELSRNEEDALANLKSLVDAIETYRHTYFRLPELLQKLSSPENGKVSADAAGLVDADLASGKKNGYFFRFVIAGANTLGAPAQYEIAVTPAAYGRTGKLSYFRDTAGVLHAADHQGAVGSSNDPKAP